MVVMPFGRPTLQALIRHSYNLLASELVEIEALFAADLDGDGRIGVVEDNGAFQLLINETGAYQISNGAGTSAVLKIGTTEVGHATFDGWSALQAEATATGLLGVVAGSHWRLCGLADRCCR